MIKVEHLTKYYGDFLAVDDLSFTMQLLDETLSLFQKHSLS